MKNGVVDLVTRKSSDRGRRVAALMGNAERSALDEPQTVTSVESSLMCDQERLKMQASVGSQADDGAAAGSLLFGAHLDGRARFDREIARDSIPDCRYLGSEVWQLR